MKDGFADVLRRGFGENLRFAAEALRAHKLRASLTIVGIVIGVATVIAMVALVEGFDANVRKGFESFGATVVVFQKFDPQFGPGGRHDLATQRLRKNLTIDDAEAIARLCPSVRAISPERYWLPSPNMAAVPLATFEGHEGTPDILGGVTDAYPEVNWKEIGEGRFFSAVEVHAAAPVAVIGSKLADALFPHRDPIGQRFNLGGRRYIVVGVLAASGPSSFDSADAHVLLPLRTFDQNFPALARDESLSLGIVPRQADLVDQVTEEATGVLRSRRGVRFDQPNDFGTVTPDLLLGSFKAVTGGISATMIFIASIALLVGGVGVMNIMLVSVTERTREIGVRKAVGAIRRDILVQFLIEAITLSAIGGAIGVGLGVGIALLVRSVTSLATVTPLWSILLGLGVSTTVGLVFGIFPAYRAAKLDPIEALRYE